LAVRDHDVGPVLSRRPEQAKRDRISNHDEESAGAMHGIGQTVQ
jgi:hypothetical protein